MRHYKHLEFVKIYNLCYIFNIEFPKLNIDYICIKNYKIYFGY